MSDTEDVRRYTTTVLPGGSARGLGTGIARDVPRRVTLACPCASVSREFETSWATADGIAAALLREHSEAAPDCPHALAAQ